MRPNYFILIVGGIAIPTAIYSQVFISQAFEEPDVLFPDSRFPNGLHYHAACRVNYIGTGWTLLALGLEYNSPGRQSLAVFSRDGISGYATWNLSLCHSVRSSRFTATLMLQTSGLTTAGTKPAFRFGSSVFFKVKASEGLFFGLELHDFQSLISNSHPALNGLTRIRAQCWYRPGRQADLYASLDVSPIRIGPWITGVGFPINPTLTLFGFVRILPAGFGIGSDIRLRGLACRFTLVAGYTGLTPTWFITDQRGG